MGEFVPNGLLAPIRLLSAPLTTEFVPNGLLELSSNQDASPNEQAAKPGLTDYASFSEARFPLDKTPSQGGSSKPATQLAAETDSLFYSQDDDLPPAFQAFGVPNDLLSTYNASSSSIPSYIRCTTFHRKIVHIRKKHKLSHEARNRLNLSSSCGDVGNLLETPIHRLMEKLSRETASYIVEARASVPAVANAQSPEETLWVDRYRPQRFRDLIGNERVARETLAWIKQWDWCVFGRRSKKRTRDEDENIKEQDEYHRPREKILLLSGPPGLGKTTLAHVVARQAGYDVMEINASDARSGQVVDERIRPALESGSAVGSTKPVLLVIDEIDGATGAGDNANTFVHKLIQLMIDRPRKKGRSKQKCESQPPRPILRPIICICNDQYASSLVKLRQHAHHIRFSRPADNHIVRRLREVCELEGLRVESRALSTLVGIAKGDLRGCLNTLQFMKSRNEEVTESVIRQATVGMKEADTSLLTVLNDLFTPLTKKRIKELGISENDESRYVARLSREIEANGRENSIASGCFAHYASLRHYDANFSTYEKANEWLTTFDMLSADMYTNGDFALSQYLPYTLVPFYPLFQERGVQRVERSQTDWENMQLTKSNEEIYKSLSRCLRSASMQFRGAFRHLLNAPVVQLEFISYINRIISPPLRPVNSQVIRPEERALLSRLVDIMGLLGLRFLQERKEDGQLTYRLDPPIDVFITYDGKRASDIPISRYAVRQLVAKELDALMLSREAAVVEKERHGRRNGIVASHSLMGPEEEDNLSNKAGPPQKRTKLDKARDVVEKPPTDFFGRPLVAAPTSRSKPLSRKPVEKKYQVTYKFTEGNAAAVRKPVKVNAFL